MSAARSIRSRLVVYGIHFVLETDAKVLLHLLNGAMPDLPGAVITRWIAWIRMFDFDPRHVKGKDNAAADALSRRSYTDQDRKETDTEGDFENFVDSYIYANIVFDEKPLDPTQVWSIESKLIAEFLVRGTYPDNMKMPERLRFAKNAAKFQVLEQALWRKGSARATPIDR